MEFYGKSHPQGSWEKIAVLGFKIFQKEGGLPLCNLIVPSPASAHQFIKSTYFEGKLSGLYQNQDIMRLEYQMVFEDVYEKCLSLTLDLAPGPRTCLAGETQLEEHAPICFGDPNHPTDRLEGRPLLFHFNRETRDIELSHISKGGRVIEIDHVLSFHKRTVGREKLSINLKVVADWVYKETQVIDLWPMLEGLCPGGCFETLSGAHLKKTWPASSGSDPNIRMVSSHLEEVSEDIVGPFEVSGDAIYLKKAQFKGRMIIEAQVKQRIKETFLLQMGDSKSGFTKDMSFYIPKHVLSGLNFFETEEGRNWISHAMNLASVYFEKHSRCYELIIETPYVDLTLDDEVRVVLPHMGEVQGKVAAYEYLAGGLCRIKLRYGRSAFPRPKDEVRGLIESAPHETPDQLSPKASVGRGNRAPLIEHIEIKNLAADQEKYIAQNQTLDIPPTSFTVHFRKGQKIIEREYEMEG